MLYSTIPAMSRFLLAFVLFTYPCICFGQAQSGPHSATSPIKEIKFSADGKRMLTASYLEAAIWNTEDFSVIRTLDFKAIGLLISDDYHFVTDPAMKQLWLKGFSLREGALVDIDQWTFFKVGYDINFISSTGVGVSWSPAAETYLVNLQTGERTHLKEVDGNYFPHLSADGKTMRCPGKGKKDKVYDFSTGKFSSAKEEERPTSKYYVDIQPVKGTISFGGITRPFAVGGGTVPEFARIVQQNSEKAEVIVLENQNTYDQALNAKTFQNYLVWYDLTSGDVKRKIALNGSIEEAKAIQAEQKRIADEKKVADDAARQARIANAKPGFKEFDAKFTNLTVPYVMNYSAAQGFALNDAFFSGDMPMRSGSEVFGMGRICSCSDKSSYLIMVRNRTESTDLSNFMIVSYDIDGTRLGSRTIGATQKDPAGVTRLDFTISGGYCGYQLKAAVTYPNGHTEDRSFSFGNCTVR